MSNKHLNGFSESKANGQAMVFQPRPTLGTSTIILRDYQQEAVDAVRNEFARGKRSTLLVLATGLGKTIVFGNITRRVIEKGGKVLILAHREELITQAVQKLDLCGVEAAVEKAEQRARTLWEPDAVVASVQTMQRKRLESWAPDYFKLLITDEAHHATAKSYRAVYRRFPTAWHLGVTATADRADEEDLGDVFESVAYEMTLWDGIRAEPPGPYLCRLKVVQCDVQIDLRDIRMTAGDFNLGDLETKIRPLVEILANAVRQEIGNRRTLIFTPDVGSATAMATALDSLGFRSEWTSGDDNDRKGKIERFRTGETQILSNCMIATEGFDVPEIAAVVLCRPTKSRPLLAQMIGRGTRLADGKQDALVIDFDYLTAKHDLVKPVELFDSTHTDREVIQIAQEIVAKKPRSDLMEAIEEAEKIHKERQVLRIQAREREVRYRRVSYDPMAICETIGAPWRGKNPDAVIHKATPGQVNCLVKAFKVDGAANMSRSMASRLIDNLSERRKAGLATYKQVSWAIAKGMDPAEARMLTFEEASKFLDSVFNKRA
jgi:superfamily II DNA or RNA helicase